MVNLVERAKEFATLAHKGQFRKYAPPGQDPEPYTEHLRRVAERIAQLPDATDEDRAIGWLHDTMEDCGVGYDQLEEQFGRVVALGVLWLSNPSKHYSALSRAERKRIDLNFISVSPANSQTKKGIDRIDNLRSVALAEPDFQRMYLQESIDLLYKGIQDADTVVWSELENIIFEIGQRLNFKIGQRINRS
jgi:GTP pyrophosphokinase